MLDKSSYFDPGSAGGPNMPGWNGVGFGPPRALPRQHFDTVAALRAWAQGARAGELVSYASERTVVREYVTALAERGFITPHLMRDPAGPALYVVQRTRTPILAGQV